jgi:hypothetical protein
VRAATSIGVGGEILLTLGALILSAILLGVRGAEAALA